MREIPGQSRAPAHACEDADELDEAARQLVTTVLRMLPTSDHERALQAMLLAARALLIARRDLQRAARGPRE